MDLNDPIPSLEDVLAAGRAANALLRRQAKRHRYVTLKAGQRPADAHRAALSPAERDDLRRAEDAYLIAMTRYEEATGDDRFSRYRVFATERDWPLPHRGCWVPPEPAPYPLPPLADDDDVDTTKQIMRAVVAAHHPPRRPVSEAERQRERLRCLSLPATNAGEAAQNERLAAELGDRILAMAARLIASVERADRDPAYHTPENNAQHLAWQCELGLLCKLYDIVAERLPELATPEIVDLCVAQATPADDEDEGAAS